MDYFLEKVSMYVKVAGKDMPPLSDEMKNLYRCNLSRMMERASAAAAAGNVPAMHTILGYAVRSAERGGVRLPTVTIEFESEEMKIVYASSLHALDEAVRPLPPPPSM
ncbi:MAG: hypothetical protein EOO38_18650 [Cytophagaceae bacterium]|nr:MAG: hypothetical protein EOO38_18650 [Cytophagaceae bacterium]